jgi:CubicO group peptidase (beta-lactamase class C family)
MRASEIVRQHLSTHPIPGAAWAVARGADLELDCAGHLWHTADAPAVTLETVWDLASLTKVLVTVPLLLKLWERGRLDLDAPLGDALPEVRGDPLATATVTQLATHTAGLEALSRLRFWGLPRHEALERALHEPRPLENGITYSDQGYIALTCLLERLYSARIDDVAAQQLFNPLEVALTYHPNPEHCAATELEGDRLLRGVVHDENTRALEGVSGHAGLFGSVRAVSDYVRTLMEGRVIGRAALERMVAPVAVADNDARAFGWVLRHPGWLGGEGAPTGAIGHTGFTGTGVWIDPRTAHFNVLLTNRVCPSRHADSGIAALRRAFNDAAWQDLLEARGH